MASIRHINCSKCGGTLGLLSADRMVKCKYCGTWSLIELKDHVPEYYIDPQIDEVGARRLLQKLLTEDDMPDNLLKSAEFYGAKLYFIPYYEFDAKRTGTVIMTEYKADRSARRQVKEIHYGPGGISTSTTREPSDRYLKKKKTVDTRVVMADVNRIDPGIALKEWALEEADIASIRSNPEGVLKIMNRKYLETMGRVYKPTVEQSDIVRNLDAGNLARNLEDHTEITDIKIKRIYYPVWRAKYKYQGRLYGASVDAVTGKIMGARAPQSDKSRILWMLGSAGITSFIIGKIAGGIMDAVLTSSLESHPFIEMSLYLWFISFAVLLMVASAIVFIIGLGWEQFRYAGELVITGDSRIIQKINRPETTFFDKANKFMDYMIGDFFESVKEGSRR